MLGLTWRMRSDILSASPADTPTSDGREDHWMPVSASRAGAQKVAGTRDLHTTFARPEFEMSHSDVAGARRQLSAGHARGKIVIASRAGSRGWSRHSPGCWLLRCLRSLPQFLHIAGTKSGTAIGVAPSVCKSRVPVPLST